MRLARILILALLSTGSGVMAASPPTVGQLAEGQKVPVDQLIRDLASVDYKTREDATRKIWHIGEQALGPLQAVADGGDPEQSFRARELIRKIELSITPETDPGVISLVERYTKALPNEKVNLLNLMGKKRAWRQILKLYASERSPELRARFQETAKEVSLNAARECVLEKRPDLAREYLEMAPADAAGLMALADFHRSQGTLADEVKRANGQEGPNAAAWRLALYRASGDVASACREAAAAGETKIAAAMWMMQGDPVPLMRGGQPMNDEAAVRRSYNAVAVKRWEGREVRPSDLDPIVRAANGRSPTDRQAAINLLFLLGEVGVAEQALVKSSPFGAFKYFESLERIPEALQALNLDPKKPDFTAWVLKRIEHLGANVAEDEHDSSEEVEQLVAMGSFLERRGLLKEAEVAYGPPLLALAKKDPLVFSSFMRSLFGNQAALSGAPALAKSIGVQWAGDDPAKWTELVIAALGEEDEPLAWWEWLPEIKEGAKPAECFDALLALFDLGADPGGLRGKWMDLAWAAVERAPEDKQAPMIGHISYLATQLAGKSGNAKEGLKAWDRLGETSRNEIFWGGHILNLSAAGRWMEAAEIFKKQVERMDENIQQSRPERYAYIAACLRAAGKESEAASNEAMANRLALGSAESALQIGHAFAYGHDYVRARQWWKRALMQADPDSGEFLIALQLMSDPAFEAGEWKQAAAFSEVLGLMYSSGDYDNESPIVMIRQRMQADTGRALAMLGDEPERARRLLEKTHQLFPTDGSLADTFFPALSKAGLREEHDRLFEITWKLMTEVIQGYPESENTYNTAAWLASRARLRLDEAEEFVGQALRMNPEQSSYLDTMAEIQFAKGDRKGALKWSALAVNFSPQESVLRRQYERFRTDPLPH